MADNLQTPPAPTDMPDQPAAPAGPEMQGENQETAPAIDDKKIEKHFKSRIASAERNAKQFYNEWKRNVELRLGKIASQYTGGVSVEDEVQTEINPDWSLTKTKTANLFSQVPTVQITAENNKQKYAPAIPPFAKSLNFEIGEKRACIGATMEECLNDVVNAAGVAAAIVEFSARFETQMQPDKDLSRFPPQIQQAAVKAGLVQMVPVEKMVDYKLSCTRISPTDLLWPSEFTGSNFDLSDFLGHRGRCAWAVAVNEFGKSEDRPNGLTEDDKQSCMAGDSGSKTEEDLRSEPDKGTVMDLENVRYKELFYWRYLVDPDEKSFSAIWRLVFVDGKTDAVIHEAWKGQKLDPVKNRYVGNVHFPIKILTLTYISDNPVPPSDSSAGRPQVNDMRRSRSQMFQNRDRSTPIRWFNTDKIDITVQDSLMRGTFQGMIPMQGKGDGAIGEVARASYPSEDLTFDAVAKQDLLELWQVSPSSLPGAMPTSGRQSQGVANSNNQAFATRMGQERNRVSTFFLGLCNVIAGYMVLYSDFPNLTDEERQGMQQAWDEKHILHDLVLKMRPDASVVQDSDFRLNRLFRWLNMLGKSPFANPVPVITEITELSGIDPSEVLVQPKPKPPEEPNVSLRLTGKDDLTNVTVVAMLLKHGKMPGPQDIENAKKLLAAANAPLQPEPQGGPQGQPGGQGAPGGPPPPPGAPGSAPPEDAHPDWGMMPKVAKRSRDMGGNG
jgi:hypothetical protein